MRIGILAVQGDFRSPRPRPRPPGRRTTSSCARAPGSRAGRRHDPARRRKHRANAEITTAPGRRPRGASPFAGRPRRRIPGDLRGHHPARPRSALPLAGLARPRRPGPRLAPTRNGYGRQIASGVRAIPSKLKPEPLEAVFIRAPIIESTGPDVEILATARGRPSRPWSAKASCSWPPSTRS